MVKFRRNDLKNIIPLGHNDLTITGRFRDGNGFTAKAHLTVSP